MHFVPSKNALVRLAFNILLLHVTVNLAVREPAEHPWMASIEKDSDLACGGVLVDKSWVLTTASCVSQGNSSDYQVVLGDYNRMDSNGKEKRISIDLIALHAGYSETTNDIALIRLSNEAKINRASIGIIPRLSKEKLDEIIVTKGDKFKMCRLTGWGKRFNKKTKWGYPGILKKLAVVVKHKTKCAKLPGFQNERNLCYTTGNNGSPCQGDAGSPVVCLIGKRWTLAALHSFGDVRDGCLGGNKAGALISYYRKWIYNTISGPNCASNPCSNPQTTCEDVAGGVYKCKCPEGYATNDNGQTCTRCSSRGQSFITAFLTDGVSNISTTLSLYIASNEKTNVTVDVPFINYRTSFEVDGYYKEILNSSIETFTPDERTFSQKGVHISANNDISVYASSNFIDVSVDGTLVFPEDCLSTSYISVSKESGTSRGSQILVVGTRNQTNVTVRHANGLSETVSLNRLETFLYKDDDTNNAVITANENIVVLSGHACGRVPEDVIANCDHQLEQMPPTESYQTKFIASYMGWRPHFSLMVTAGSNGTAVNIRDVNGSVIETVELNEAMSQFFNFYNRTTVVVEANRGVLVTQFGHGYETNSANTAELGDPSMVVIPAITEFDSSYSFVVPQGFDKNLVSITISDTFNISGLQLDGSSGAANSTVPSVIVPGLGSYSIAYFEGISAGAHTITHTDGLAEFGGIVVGQLYHAEYSWAVGRYVAVP